METGKVIVEKVRGKSTLTKCFSKYPLKFINPKNVAPSQTDVVWIYAITYGGGIVSGDSIVCDYTIGDGCTTVLTTQASTKVYKAVGTKISEQVLEARIGSNAFLAVIPDPVTCFSTAKYSQKQVFKVMSDSSLLLVDWITSGRHETGEKWNFDLYRSMNNIFHNDDEPLFLDTALLEQGTCSDIAERMQDYQVIAMVILLGCVGYSSAFICFGKKEDRLLLLIYRPKLKHVQNQIQEDVKKIMSQSLHMPTIGSRQSTSRHNDHHLTKPSFLASCSIFGPKGIGVVTRIAAMTTESVYNFLQHQLSSMEPLLGVKPYSYAS